MAEAIRMPAVEGTQGTLAGTLRRPGDGASSCRVSAAGSGLYTTFRCRMPRSRSSRRMTRARGQTEVLEMSVICGGHADGDRDLLAVAMREVTEETGLRQLELLHPGIFSLECLTVDGHEKRGQYVPSHIHMNVTYLLGARDRELRQKPDENSGVAWFTPREALEASTEPWMVQRVYSKLTQRAAAYMAR